MSETSAPRLKTAIVGAGLMGRWHLAAARDAGADVVAVCDTDLGAARRLGGRIDARTARSLEEVSGLADVVHICTPLDTHVGLATEALNGGAHVVVEKPLAPTASQLEPLLELAERNHRRLVSTHQLCFQRWLPRVASLGALRTIDYVVCTAGAAAAGAEAEAVVNDVLPHPLSLFAFLGPELLRDAEWRVARLPHGELRAQTQTTETSLGIRISTSGRPTRHEIEIVGTRGSLSADLFHGFAIVERPHAGRIYKVLRPLARSARVMSAASWNLVRRAATRQAAYPGLRELIAALYAEIRSGAAGPAGRIDADHLRAVARARDAILGA